MADDTPCAGLPDQVCCGGICCELGKCCTDGACVDYACTIGGKGFKEGTVNPAEFCEVCDSAFPAEWSLRFHPDCPRPCIIGDVYIAYGTTNPLNECEECDCGRNVTSWSSKDHNTRCGSNQDQFCCQRVCCAPGACCTPDGACEVGGALVRDGCDIDGRIYRTDETNPANICEHCDSGLSTTAWSPQDNNTSRDSGADHRVCCNRVCCIPGELCIESEKGSFFCKPILGL